MFPITRRRLLAAAFGLTAAVASAQEGPIVYGPVVGCPLGNCAAANHGTYGPALFAVNPAKKHFGLPGPNEPECVGRSSYPLSDWHYIRQFCGPTLQPGTCYGHFQTKWRKWEDHCPNPGGCATAAPGVTAPPAVLVPQPTVPTPPPPLPQETPKAEPPKGEVPKVDPVPPPKIPLVPKETGLTPAPLPVVPAPSATGEPRKISSETAAPIPMPPPPLVVPPTSFPRLVVPPTPR
jgi:hypothetical protein